MKPRAIMHQGARRLPYTHVATGLALAACRQRHRARFSNVATLVNDLVAARAELQLSRFMASLCKQDLLVLDAFGFVPFSREGANLLFQLCSALYERVAVIITFNLSFGEWKGVMCEKHLTAALLDRLAHRAHILEFLGESFRFRQKLKQSELPTEGDPDLSLCSQPSGVASAGYIGKHRSALPALSSG